MESNEMGMGGREDMDVVEQVHRHRVSDGSQAMFSTFLKSICLLGWDRRRQANWPMQFDMANLFGKAAKRTKSWRQKHGLAESRGCRLISREIEKKNEGK